MSDKLIKLALALSKLRMTLPRRAAAIAVLLIGCEAATARLAYAQEGNDKAAADVLFEQGRALLDAGKVAEACPKFAESNRLDPGIGTMLFLAECWQRAGKTASAWVQFRDAEALAAKEGDKKREKVAHDRAQTLAPTLATLTIRILPNATADSIVITRDGREVGAALLGTKTPIDPGEHVVQASAKGFSPWEKHVDVHTAENVLVEIPKLTPIARPLDVDPPPQRSWQKPLALGLAALGVVSVGVGSAFGLSAIAKNDRAEGHCNNLDCDADGVALGEKADEHGNIATVGFAVGAALIIGGAVLFFTAPSNTSSPQHVGARAKARSPLSNRRAPLTFTF